MLIILAADRIKKLRELKGITQTQLAKTLGITRSSVNAWEMGISIPSTQKIIELAILFHASTDYILGLDDKITLDLNSYNDHEIALIYQLTNYMDEIKDKEQE